MSRGNAQGRIIENTRFTLLVNSACPIILSRRRAAPPYRRTNGRLAKFENLLPGFLVLAPIFYFLRSDGVKPLWTNLFHRLDFRMRRQPSARSISFLPFFAR